MPHLIQVVGTLALYRWSHLIVACGIAFAATLKAADSAPTAGLVAYYPFNGNANDQSGNGRNGTINGAQLAADRFGQSNSAYLFDGDSIVYPGLPVNLTGPYTFSAWVKLFTSADGTVMFELSDGANCNANPVLWKLGSQVAMNHCGGGHPDIPFESVESMTNRWRHVVLSVENGVTKLYRDGVLISATTGQVWPTSAAITLTLGAVRGGIGQFSVCVLDDIRVYSRALSNSEVEQLFAIEALPPTALTNGLVAYYPFNGNANDQSGNSRHGTVNGAQLRTDRFGASNSAYEFDGDSIICTNIPTNLKGTYTFSAWIDLYAYQNGNALLELSSGSVCNANPVLWQINSQVDLNHCGGGWPDVVFDSAANVLNRWRHFVMSVENGLTKVYRDGILISTTTEPWPTTTAITLTLGAVRNGIGQFSMCAIDDVRIYSRVLSSQEVQLLYATEAPPPTPTSPPANGLVAYYPFTGNANDESGQGRHGTVNGAQLTLDRFGNANSAYQFSNATIVSTGIPINLAGPYTYSAWIDLHRFEHGRNLFELGDGDACNGNPQMFQFGSQVFYAHCGSGESGLNSFGSATELTNRWRQLVVAVENGITRVYRDGVLLSATPQTWPATTVIKLNLGGTRGFTSLVSLDDIRIYNRALSSNEVQQLYIFESQPPTPPLSPTDGLVAHYPFSGNASDTSGNGNHGLVSNASVTVDRFGTLNSAYYFAGQNSQVMVSDNSALRSLGSNYTFNAWARFQSAPSIDSAILFKSAGAGGQRKWTFWRHVQASPLGIGLLLFRPSDGQYQWNFDYPFATNRWYMLTFSSSGTNCAIAVDGVVVSVQPGNMTLPDTTGVPLSIGGAEPGGGQWFNGSLDDIRIYNRGLSSNEIQQLYAVESTPTDGLVAHYPFSGNANDASGNSNHGAVSNATLIVDRFGAANSAFNFNGQNSQIVVSDNAALRSLQSNYTFNAWARFQSAPSIDSAILLKSAGAGGQRKWTFWRHVQASPLGIGLLLFRPSDGQYQWNFDYPFVSNRWYMLTFSSTGTNCSIAVDGVVASVQPGNLTLPNTTDVPLSIGGAEPGGNQWFNGSLDDIRIYNRALSSNEIQQLYQAEAPAAPTTPVITSQPTSRTVLVGAAAPFSVGAVGTAPLGYQWRFNGTNLLNGGRISGATSSQLVISNVQLSDAGSYSVIVSNSVKSVTSSNATLTVTAPPALVSVVSTTKASGGLVTVPIRLLANGNENALGFSLTIGSQILPAVLTFDSVVLGSNAVGASLLVNTNQLGSSRIGVALALPSGTTFAAGTQEVVQLRFQSSVLTGIGNRLITLNFGDQPTVRQLSSASAAILTATYQNGTVTLTPSDLEGDSTPRPNGDRVAGITDWVQLGRFVALLDTAAAGGEFQRADCAPRESLGDGQLKVTDWVQAGRYAAGLDPLLAVGGPTSPGALRPQSSQVSVASSGRELRTLGASVYSGQSISVPVILESQGDENALSFSLAFDPAVFSYTDLALGSNGIGLSPNVNTSQLASGKLGVVVGLPAGNTFAVGQRELLKMNLVVLPAAMPGSYPIGLGDQPVPRGVSDPGAGELTSTYAAATLSVALPLTLAGTVRYYPTNYPPSNPSIKMVGGVTVNFTGDTITNMLTPGDGTYSQTSVPFGGDYCLVPGKTNDTPTASGVTVLDIALIRQHLLTPASTTLTTPYKLLAADVNNSSTISILDIAFLRQVILGITNRFPAGLWRFVPAEYEFPNTNLPWSAPASLCVPDLITHATDRDLVAIKLGDVNGSWTPPSSLSPASEQSLANLGARPELDQALALPRVTFEVSRHAAQPGQMVNMTVSARGFHQVTSAQFTLAWNPAVLRFVGLGQLGVRGLSAASFGTDMAEVGRLTFAWDDPLAAGLTLEDGAAVFGVTFQVIGEGDSASSLTFLDTPTVREVGVNFVAASFGSQDGEVTVVGPVPPKMSFVDYAGGRLRLSVPTMPGQRYILEFTDSLPGSNWTPLSTLTGDGTARLFTDANATNHQRYYRVRME